MYKKRCILYFYYYEPISINNKGYIEQVFRENEVVWITFISLERTIIEEDSQLLEYLIEEIRNMPFIQELHAIECRILVQILTENQQSIATGEITK